MDRRSFLLGGAAAVLSCTSALAQGIHKLSVSRPNVVKQQCAEWCWAASSSMIFENLGHSIDQKKIVQKVYGGTICAAAPTITISSVLNASWTDDDGESFQPEIIAGYDQMSGIASINNMLILDELKNGRMLLYANTHHCMAITEADFVQTPLGPNILKVVVLDPWPGSPDEHPLSPTEIHPVFAGGSMTYLAAVRLSSD